MQRLAQHLMARRAAGFNYHQSYSFLCAQSVYKWELRHTHPSLPVRKAKYSSSLPIPIDLAKVQAGLPDLYGLGGDRASSVIFLFSCDVCNGRKW